MEKPTEIITRLKAKLGDQLAILGHHYQSDEVIAHTDIQGDSLELARKINDLDARFIVFCGVFFMAESAAILCRPDQQVFIPDTSASCPMADMAEAGRVETTLNILQKNGRKIIPLTYVNSSAAVKAIVGRFDGSVCTSANAQTMLEWAVGQGDAVLFLPDMHLARNTANKLNILMNTRMLLPHDVIHGDPDIALNANDFNDKQFIIWPGFCPIHEKFTMERINEIRTSNPDAKIVVHPECDPSLVDASDGDGSTTFLIDYAAKAPKGATIYVGTEENLVKRLATSHADIKTIKPLLNSRCDDMGKITLAKLAATLENLSTESPVEVSEDIKNPAKIALERMLAVCS